MISSEAYFPNGRLLLEALTLTLERFRGGSRAAIPLPVLRQVVAAAVSALPFDEEFYLSQYPDIKAAVEAGEITDPRSHFVQDGYFEGRFWANPNVDEKFYGTTYPDVAQAITQGVIGSGREHYLRTGAYEGRFANEEELTASSLWAELLHKK